MSEPVTPLGDAVHDGFVRVRALPARGMISVRGDLEAGLLSQTLSDLTGVAMPGPRGADVPGETGLLWMSPDEAMVLCPYGEVAERLAALNAALAGEHVLCADVSDARAVFALEGAGLREVLAKLTPADLRPQALPVGELRRTRLAQVSAAFWLGDERTATLICFRSVAGYVFDLLGNAARPEAAVAYF